MPPIGTTGKPSRSASTAARTGAAPAPADALLVSARTAALSRLPYRRDLSRDDQVAARRRPDLLNGHAGGDLAQGHPVLRHLEQAEIGDNEVDDAARGGR